MKLKHYLLASDFDQTLSFNDSGLVLSHLIGASGALEAAASHLEDRGGDAPPAGTAFDTAIGNLRSSLREANTALDDLRARLDAVG